MILREASSYPSLPMNTTDNHLAFARHQDLTQRVVNALDGVPLRQALQILEHDAPELIIGSLVVEGSEARPGLGDEKRGAEAG